MEKRDPSKREVKPDSRERRKVIVKGEDRESTDREHHEENLKKGQKLINSYENQKIAQEVIDYYEKKRKEKEKE